MKEGVKKQFTKVVTQKAREAYVEVQQKQKRFKTDEETPQVVETAVENTSPIVTSKEIVDSLLEQVETVVENTSSTVTSEETVTNLLEKLQQVRVHVVEARPFPEFPGYRGRITQGSFRFYGFKDYYSVGYDGNVEKLKPNDEELLASKKVFAIFLNPPYASYSRFRPNGKFEFGPWFENFQEAKNYIEENALEGAAFTVFRPALTFIVEDTGVKMLRVIYVLRGMTLQADIENRRLIARIVAKHDFQIPVVELSVAEVKTQYNSRASVPNVDSVQDFPQFVQELKENFNINNKNFEKQIINIVVSEIEDFSQKIQEYVIQRNEFLLKQGKNKSQELVGTFEQNEIQEVEPVIEDIDENTIPF